MHTIRRLLAFAMVASIVPAVSAQEPSRAEIVKRIKSATAFVQAGERGSGSAFCVHESGYFLTNEHVVRKLSEVTLVLNAGLDNQQIVSAKVVRVDAEYDLALLKVDEKLSCAALPLGSSDGLVEQTELIAAGYPFGKELALEKGEYPSISINAGKISSLRLKKGELERIQMDAVVNPGNSGGPIVDSKGKVIGVVVSGVRGAAVNFAIPVNHAHRFVGTPEIDVQLPTVAFADRFKIAKFQLKMASVLPVKDPYEVELILGAGDSAERTVAMKLDKDVYRADAEPLARPNGPAPLKATLFYPTGNVTGLIADRAFKIGSTEVKLASVRSIRFGPEATAVLSNNKIVKGPLTGFGEISLQLGTDTMKINPTKAVELSIAPPEADRKVEFAIIVRSGGKEVARLRDSLAFQGSPAGATAKESASPAKGPQKLEGFWVVEQTESKGKIAWPRSPEEAIYIEGNVVQWAKKDGTLPNGAFEADLEVIAGKSPQQITLTLKRGPGNGQKWQVIYKIEGNLLTIATNCHTDRCPTLFTTRAEPGSAQFVRTYRRVME